MERSRALLRADVLHPPLRGDAPRPLLPGEARRHDAHLHRAGGERRRRHRPPRAGARRRLLEPPLPRPLPRVHGRRVRAALRGDGEGDRRRAAARAEASTCTAGTSTRTACSGASSRSRPGSRSPRSGKGPARLDGLPRRRHARRGRRLRVAEHRLALEPPGPLRRRGQRLRAVDASRARAAPGSIAARAARRSGSRPTSWTRPTSREIHDAAGRAVARIRETGEPFFLVLHTYRFSPHSKGDDNRDPAEIERRRERDPLTVVAGARPRRLRAPCDRGRRARRASQRRSPTRRRLPPPSPRSA